MWYIFVMNVFKIKEVINVFKFNIMLGLYYNLKGVMNYWGSFILIIDLC